MAIYDAIDLEWMWDGDFARGKDGDLKDTSYDLIQALIQEIQAVVKSDIGDWKEHPTLAAGIKDYQGEPNTRKTGDAIKNRVISILTSHNIVKRGDLDVRVIPVHIHEVLIMIKVNATATSGNSLELGQPIVMSFIYNSVEDSVWYVPENRIAENF